MVLTNKVYLESCRVVVGENEEYLLDRRLYVNSNIHIRRASIRSFFDKRRTLSIDDIIKRKLPWY